MNVYLDQQRLWQVLRFLLIFNLMAIPLHILLSFEFLLNPLTALERNQVSFFLSLFGVKHSLVESEIPGIKLNSQIILIGEACTAWRSIFAFLALVVASPCSWKSKRRALLGIPVIYAVNILRLVGICLVALCIPSIVEFVHTILWREGLMLVIFALWYYWFKKARAF